jgi:hypothetical protein
MTLVTPARAHLRIIDAEKCDKVPEKFRKRKLLCAPGMELGKTNPGEIIPGRIVAKRAAPRAGER